MHLLEQRGKNRDETAFFMYTGLSYSVFLWLYSKLVFVCDSVQGALFVRLELMFLDVILDSLGFPFSEVKFEKYKFQFKEC